VNLNAYKPVNFYFHSGLFRAGSVPKLSALRKTAHFLICQRLLILGWHIGQSVSFLYGSGAFQKIRFYWLICRKKFEIYYHLNLYLSEQHA